MAADKTSDPTLAVAALGDLTRFVQEDGTVDTDAMSDALDDAIEKHPALTKDDATPSGGGPGGGPRPPAGEGKPKDLKEALQRRLAGTRT